MRRWSEMKQQKKKNKYQNEIKVLRTSDWFVCVWNFKIQDIVHCFSTSHNRFEFGFVGPHKIQTLTNCEHNIVYILYYNNNSIFMNFFLHHRFIFSSTWKRYFHLFLSQPGRRWIHLLSEIVSHLTQKDNVCMKERKYCSLIPHSIFVISFFLFTSHSECFAIELCLAPCWISTGKSNKEWRIHLTQWIPNKTARMDLFNVLLLFISWTQYASSCHVRVARTIEFAHTYTYHIWYHHFSLHKLITYSSISMLDVDTITIFTSASTRLTLKNLLK